ncbi:MAG: hypothetical protein WC314_13925 [Vulcanimicrobiota bacterium]
MSNIDRSRAMSRKTDDKIEEEEGKPTLKRQAGKMPSRAERIIGALNGLDDERLKKLITQIGPDELAVAIMDADAQLKQRIGGFMPPDKIAVYNEYLVVDRSRLPKDVVDGVQGKLLRLIV